MRTEDGEWDCESVDLVLGTGPWRDARDVMQCAGDGGHEGLTAIVQMDWGAAASSDGSELPSAPFEAIVFSGQVPPAPDPAAIE